MSANRVEIDAEMLEKINGGAFKYTPNDDGSFTLTGDFTGGSITLPGTKFFDVISILSNLEDTEAGEIEALRQMAALK